MNVGRKTSKGPGRRVRTSVRAIVPALFSVAGALAVLIAGSSSFAQETPPPGTPQLTLVEDETLLVPFSDAVEENGVPQRVSILEGKDLIREACLEGGFVRIDPAPDSSGSFRLRIHYSAGGTERSIDRRGIVRPRTDLLSGMLQNSETHAGQQGLVRIYTAARELVAEVRAAEDGRFPAAPLALDRGKYTVQAVLTRNSSPAGFVRTMNVTVAQLGDDLHIPTIRAVPFDGLSEMDVDPSAFRDHVLLVTRGSIKRWDLDAMKGVFIVEATSEGRFSAGEVQRIRRLFEAPDAVPAFVRGRAFQVHESRSSGEQPYANAGGSIVPAPGWIVIAPGFTSVFSSASTVADADGSGAYDRGLILINSPRAALLADAYRLVTYEAGRILGMVANSDPNFFTHTMMVSGGGPQVPERPTLIDRKTGAILYEESFPVGLDLDLVLGLDFDLPIADLRNAPP